MNCHECNFRSRPPAEPTRADALQAWVETFVRRAKTEVAVPRRRSPRTIRLEFHQTQDLGVVRNFRSPCFVQERHCCFGLPGARYWCLLRDWYWRRFERWCLSRQSDLAPRSSLDLLPPWLLPIRPFWPQPWLCENRRATAAAATHCKWHIPGTAPAGCDKQTG